MPFNLFTCCCRPKEKENIPKDPVQELIGKISLINEQLLKDKFDVMKLDPAFKTLLLQLKEDMEHDLEKAVLINSDTLIKSYS